MLNEEVPWAPMWVTTRFGGASNTVGNFVWTPAAGGGSYYDPPRCGRSRSNDGGDRLRRCGGQS